MNVIKNDFQINILCLNVSTIRTTFKKKINHILLGGFVKKNEMRLDFFYRLKVGKNIFFKTCGMVKTRIFGPKYAKLQHLRSMN